MRHGHALSAHEAGVGLDSERPLSGPGESGALEACRRLSASGFVPDLIISSPFLRADRTAGIAAGVFPAASRRTSPAISDGPLGSLLELIADILPGRARVLLVGHQPLIGAAAGFLLGQESFDLSPAGFVRLDTGKGPGTGALIEFYAPARPEGQRR